MPCLVCGDPVTVRSHIIPRALFHAMKRPGARFVGTRRDGPGWRELQSGFADDRLLCNAHEGRLSVVDDYGVSFCKDFLERNAKNVQWAEVPNPHPDRLVEFACAVVWRSAASVTDLDPKKVLGPYAGRLANFIFEAKPFNPVLLVSRQAYRLKGEPLNFGALPYPYSELERRFWRFIVCGLIFDLMLDARGAPPPMATLVVNEAKVITLIEDFPQAALRTQPLRRALVEMSLPRRPHPR